MRARASRSKGSAARPAGQIFPRPGRRLRRGCCLLASAGLVLGGLLGAPPALAAGESGNVWLTTTSGSAGRNVVEGLQQQAPVAFSAGHAGTGQVTGSSTP